MPDFLAISKPLIERGFSVIPLIASDKRPLPGWGVTRRSRDIEQLRSLFPNGEYANVGICADENVVILETDDLQQFQQVIQNSTAKIIPLTLMACGSSENRPHLFFKRTEKSTNVGNLVVPGLFEARFNNQYVVGPGSIHPSGATYRFLNDAPLVDIPDWLVSELARLSLSQARPNSRAVEISGGRVPEGSRHYFIMRELGRLWDGKLTEDEMVVKAESLNELCDPPKDAAHVMQCVRDIMRREPYDPGPKVVLGKKKEVTSEAFKYAQVPGRTRDYVLQPLHSPFDGWFPRGRVSIVGGSSGVGKTTLIVDLLSKQHSGEPYLDHGGCALSFLVVFADRTSLSNKETLERMGMDRADMPIAYMPICWDGNAVNNILDKIEEHGCPAAVFIEGADALVSDANKAQVVAPFMTGLQKVAEWYHTALILSCGAPKQKPKEQYAQTRDRVFGSQMWARMAEDVLILTYGTEGTDERHLIVEHRNAKKEKFDLVFEGGLLVPKPPETMLAGVKETAKTITDWQAQMIEHLETLPEGSVIKPRDTFSWVEVSPTTMTKYLQQLSRPAGWLKREDGNWIVRKSQMKGVPA